MDINLSKLGFIYFIETGLPNHLIKIGKTHFKFTTDYVIDKLYFRYNTYYPDMKIINIIEVHDCDNAEKFVFNFLSDFHYKNELFFYQKSFFENSYISLKTHYPSFNTILSSMEISELNKLNSYIKSIS